MEVNQMRYLLMSFLGKNEVHLSKDEKKGE